MRLGLGTDSRMRYNRFMAPQGSVEGDHMEPLTEFDAMTNAMRGLFEIVAHLVVLFAAAIIPGALFLLALPYAPDLVSRPTAFVIFLALTLATGVAIGFLRDAAKRRGKQDASELLAKRYAFPITLAAGLYIGVMWQQHDARYSESGRAAEATIKVCLRLPHCSRMADRAYQGEVISALPRYVGGLN